MNKWRFIHVADIQPGSPRSYRYNPSWIKNWDQAKTQILAMEPDLLLVGGDITRDGGIHRFELEEMKADLDRLPFPVHVIPGNMDTGNKHADSNRLNRGEGQCTDLELNVTSAQLQQFAEVFGPLWWSVDHKGVRFSGFADVVVNSGLPEEEAFWRWAEEQRQRPRVAHHVWIMHYAMFADNLREPDWNPDTHYMEWYFCVNQPGRDRLAELFKGTATDLVISGHIHCHKRFAEEGMRFEIAPGTSFSQWHHRWPDGNPAQGFLCYDVTGEGVGSSTFVPLEKTCKLEGYGPGGHPVPGMRDYSKAWSR